MSILNLRLRPKRRNKLNRVERAEVASFESQYVDWLPDEVVAEIKQQTALGKIASDRSLKGEVRRARTKRIGIEDEDLRMKMIRGKLVARLHQTQLDLRIHTAIAMTGQSNKWLAERVGVNGVQVGRWCSGQLPNVKHCERIADAFGLLLDEFWSERQMDELANRWQDALLGPSRNRRQITPRAWIP